MTFQEIQSSRRGLSGNEIRGLLMIIAAIIGLLGLNIYLAHQFSGGEWLYLRWSAARAYWFGQTEPYSSTIAMQTQLVAYGRQAAVNEYPYVLNDPFYIVLLYTPIAIIPEFLKLLYIPLDTEMGFSVAHGIWMLLSEGAIVWVVIQFIRFMDWNPPYWIYISLIAAGLLGVYSISAFQSGSLAPILVFLYVTILVSLKNFSDELAGGLLFLVFYQWEVSILFLLFVLVFVIVNKRWKVFNGFFMTLIILMVASFLAYQDWLIPFARGFLTDWYRSPELTFGYIVSGWFPGIRFSIGFWTAWLLGFVVLLEWIGGVKSGHRRFAWVSCLSLAATPLMGFPIFDTNNIVLLPGLILILMLVWERWRSKRVLFFGLILFLSVFGPYALLMQRNISDSQNYMNLLRVLPAIATIIGLYWMRWWVMSRQPMWADEFRGRL